MMHHPLRSPSPGTQTVNIPTALLLPSRPSLHPPTPFGHILSAACTPVPGAAPPAATTPLGMGGGAAAVTVPGSPTEELRDLHVVMLTKQLAELQKRTKDLEGECLRLREQVRQHWHLRGDGAVASLKLVVVVLRRSGKRQSAHTPPALLLLTPR